MTEPKPQGVRPPTAEELQAVFGGPMESPADIDRCLKDLVRWGLLVEVEPGMYRITPAGRAAAQTAMYGAPLS